MDDNLEIDIKRKKAIDMLKESKGDYYAGFRKISRYYSVEEMLLIFDIKTLRSLFNGNKKEHEYKFFVILMEKDANTTVSYVLQNDEMFDEMFKLNNNFYSMFGKLDYNLFRDVILKMGENVVNYPRDFIRIMNSEKQKLLLSENISDEMLIYILNVFSNDALSYFFEKDSRAIYLFEKFNIKQLIDRGIKFNDKIVKKKEFFDLLKGQSIVELRYLINKAEKNNNALCLEERMQDYHSEIINSYDSESGVFKDYLRIINDPKFELPYDQKSFIIDDKIFYNISKYRIYNYRTEEFVIKKEELTEYLKDLTSKKLSEIVVDALFEDNIYNVWLNIREMLRYNEKLQESEKVIDSDKEEFYKKILNIDNISCEEKIDLYNNLKDKKISFMYYYDLRKLKDLSYDLIKRDLFNVDNVKKNNLNLELTDKYGVSVFDMRDEEYTMLIRCQGKYRESDVFRRNCYTIIGNENTSSFGEHRKGTIYYGYNSFENDRVIHVLEQDSFSTDVTDEQPSRFVNRIMTSDELVRASNWYSEVDIVNIKNENGEYDVKKPDYLVYYDDSNNFEEYVEEAKRLNISIVIIKNTELSLDRKIDIDFDMNTDYYTDYEDRYLREGRYGGFGRR